MYSNIIKKNKHFLKLVNGIENGMEILKYVEGIQKYLVETEKSDNKSENKFIKEFYNHLLQLNKKTLLIEDKKNQLEIKELFRGYIKEYILKSPLCKHGYIKPKGYPGDYRIIEAIYNNKSVAPINTIGYLFDQFLLKAEYVQAVRDRKNKMKVILKDYLNRNKSKKIKILNIACGSCREIRELLNENFFINKTIEFVLIDQDKECLDYSKKLLKETSPNLKFHFLQNNVYSFFRNDKFERRFKEFDFIYSIGLADYLSDMVLGDMIQKGFDRLAKDGEFIIAHKNVKQFNSVPSEWVCDWNFIPRDRKDLRSLIKENLLSYNYKAQYENLKSKLIFFIKLEKRIKSC